MKYLPTLLASLMVASVATAGPSAPAPGKGPQVVPEPACPDMLNYSYLEAGWIRLDQDNDLSEQNGGYAELSYEFLPRFTVDGSATIYEDLNQFGIGIGTYVPLAKAFHLTGRTGYSYTDIDGADSLNEWYVAPGFRAQIGCHLELWGKLYINIGEDDTELSWGGGVTYHIDEHVGITVGAAKGDDAWSLQTGLRYQF